MQPTGVLDSAKATNPLKDLLKFGQSVWLDYIRRDLISSGELKRLIEEDGLRGMTSNPAIFEKAIAGSTDYADILASLKGRSDLDAKARYELIAIRDIQDAADLLGPVYQESNLRDGYISLEVSPYLARDTRGTLEEARRLWKAVDRPNIMIKVPGTAEGIPAFEQLIGEGININVTLLFSQHVYQQVAEAYIRGLERFAASGGGVKRIASVASFFISRIDNSVDAEVSRGLKSVKGAEEEAKLKGLLGKVAIANGKLAYQRYLNIFSGPEWDRLRAKGGQTQRVLWASTSTKNPAYRDILYVEELIGPDTVNTIPPATFDAFRDHGQPRETLTEGVEEAKRVLEDLSAAGISIDRITSQLTDDGVRLFEEAFDKLLAAVEKSTQGSTIAKISQQSSKLAEALAGEVAQEVNDWRAGGRVRRLWQRDASLWTGGDEAQWLGWLDIAEKQHEKKDQFARLTEEIRREGFTGILLLGMGGSSLCPEVLARTYGQIQGFPRLEVLDSTDPAQVKAAEKKVDLAKTLFIVSSKSGTTLEPNIFKQYFFERVKETLGGERAGSRFIAITDPGSHLEKEAEADKFRYVFHGVASIGGRYSALSNFGMVPAAAMGLDVAKFLDRSEEMVQACAASVPVEKNPGVMLGIILGTAAKSGRDKLTLVASPAISDLGAWLEQLLAESTGKQGKGIIPVDRERLESPDVYGGDRLFAYLRYEPAPDADQDGKIAALEEAGQPVIRISIGDTYDLGQEFFRWEMATAVAGSILGINAFNQPDVEASKVATRKLTSEYERTGSLPAEKPVFEQAGISLFADPGNAGALGGGNIVGRMRAHLDRLRPGDYFALLAYLEMSPEHQALLEEIRHGVRDAKQVATCLGFGPRFLHSTGQAYKGGPNSGVFLQITSKDAHDLGVPGQKYSFGVVKAAQARGDFEVLAERGRRALRVDLGKDVETGLSELVTIVARALSK
ncbi:MAG: bifunctional transaldolase/phosoglucose isomerase [Acidobacteria bacterium]|nr:bifunctional transaldolase/phosoglucose isomerase [Acidobacteriota bacterium]